MTRERCKELLPVMEAWARGETIECRRLGSSDKWESFGDILWLDECEYRIKPKPLEVWINVYSAGHSSSDIDDDALAFATQQEAEQFGKRFPGYRHTIKLREVEEGQ
jgi:hypothetical protein